MKNDYGELLADSHNILNTWKNCFSHLLNVHRVIDVNQIEICTAELLVPDSSPFKVEIAIEKLKRYESPSSDQILAEPIQAGGETLRSEIHKRVNPFLKKKKLPDQW
jgi:hypothetical protein